MRTVKLSDLIIEFDDAPAHASWEPPHTIFQMADHIDRLQTEVARGDEALTQANITIGILRDRVANQEHDVLNLKEGREIIAGKLFGLQDYCNELEIECDRLKSCEVVMRAALQVAFNHLDMQQLQVSHCKDHAAIMAAMQPQPLPGKQPCPCANGHCLSTGSGLGLNEELYYCRSQKLKEGFHNCTFKNNPDIGVVVSQPTSDPCPQCERGGVCASVSCGRKRSSELMTLYGVPAPLEEAFAKEPERSICEAALQRLSQPTSEKPHEHDFDKGQCVDCGAIEAPSPLMPTSEKQCEDCHGTGRRYIGNSGQESDGNAPEFEDCDNCEPPQTEVVTMSKLWLVEVKVMAVVVADNEDFAEEVALEEIRRIVDDSDTNDFTISTQYEVTSPDFKCGGWDKMCIPYGDDSDARIGERLLAQNSGGTNPVLGEHCEGQK